MTIHGGTVTATGGQLAPGIGAGYEGTSDGTLALAPGLGGVYLPEATPDSVGSAPVGDRTETIGGRSFRSRLHADLYQLGIGPRVTWHALSWLDVYAGADILLNIDSTRFEADGSACSRTDSLVGFGGNVGVVGRLTDWVGVYGQVGYEWGDRNRLSAGGFSAEIDYSSLVLSAGLQFRF